MKLASVLQARSYGLVEITELNPRGNLYFPDVVEALVARYRFQKYPTKFDDFDETKGIQFEGGVSEGVAIDKFVILNSGIYVDTAADTDASDAVLQDCLSWAASELGIVYRPEMMRRKAYISQLTFYSDAPILELHPVLQKLCTAVSHQVRENFGQSLQYQPTGISMVYDQLTTNFGTAAFTVQRREGVPFSDGKYFSAAPVKTRIHLELLEELERSVTSPR
jgi:hypothetical protein